jgi:hypothetical protein
MLIGARDFKSLVSTIPPLSLVTLL